MSSTIWNRRPSSSANTRHGACSRSGTSATHSATPTDAANRHPVFKRCSVAPSVAVPVMSRYCPPIIPSVACASSRPTSAYRAASTWPCSSGVSARSPRYPSTSARSSSGLRIVRRLSLRPLQLFLDRLAQLGELAEHVERLLRVVRLREPLELGARLLQPCEQLLGAGERFLG